ncbi:MAG: hypothetical protein A2252_00645 [Elusimicrobia bacterium RIFOXYA2_FULL_39_19]|nr:MAG: hypothetical protein A2252_00645 [Elusimicrobia bacterium RIFOXYA2_FULL_39_19]
MKKILIIKPSGIGDIIHSLPAAYGLKNLYPEAKIYWLVFGKFEKVLHNTPVVDKLILWNRQGGFKEYKRVIKEIRAEQFDLVIDLQALMRTAIITRLSKGKTRLAVSLVRELAWLFEKPIGKFDPAMHAVDRNYEIVKYLAQTSSVPADFLPWIKLTSQETSQAQQLMAAAKIAGDKIPVLFVVTTRGLHKMWPLEHFSELINRCNAEYNIIPVFLAMKEEGDIVRRITNRLKCAFIDLTGKTDLRTACAVTSLCKLVVGNDTALIHVASALNIPVIGLYGATDPAQVGPYGKQNTVILNKLPCWPCGIKSTCKDNKCMKEISPQKVFEACGKYLKK